MCVFVTALHIEGSSVKAIEVVRARLYTIFSHRRSSVSEIFLNSLQTLHIEYIFSLQWKEIKIYAAELYH